MEATLHRGVATAASEAAFDTSLARFGNDALVGKAGSDALRDLIRKEDERW